MTEQGGVRKGQRGNIEIEDLIGAVGILLLAIALYLLLGWPGVIGYIGTILTTVAYRMAERKRYEQ